MTMHWNADATQWSDIDGDGFGDNPAGRLYDLFPENPTQWEDVDGDGLDLELMISERFRMDTMTLSTSYPV